MGQCDLPGPLSAPQTAYCPPEGGHAALCTSPCGASGCQGNAAHSLHPVRNTASSIATCSAYQKLPTPISTMSMACRTPSPCYQHFPRMAEHTRHRHASYVVTSRYLRGVQAIHLLTRKPVGHHFIYTLHLIMCKQVNIATVSEADS